MRPTNAKEWPSSKWQLLKHTSQGTQAPMVALPSAGLSHLKNSQGFSFYMFRYDNFVIRVLTCRRSFRYGCDLCPSFLFAYITRVLSESLWVGPPNELSQNHEKWHFFLYRKHTSLRDDYVYKKYMNTEHLDVSTFSVPKKSESFNTFL